ncbi:MAG: NAD(P)/FAD-dependent oxidoreductase [Chitinophagaceae bacterium]
MQKNITIKLLPSEAANEQLIRQAIAQSLGCAVAQVRGFQLLRRSIDARSRQPWVQLSLLAFINEPALPRDEPVFLFDTIRSDAPEVFIAGAGPAGLFAALKLIEAGIRPILLERGKDVRARRRDLAAMNKNGIVNPESNYCFGEGGAGTYSDGKLYTRSSKRGDVKRILDLFIHFGASPDIAIDAHPHIGTNKLPHIISAMRECIIACGGRIHFEKKLTGLLVKNDVVVAVQTADGDTLPCKALILATGHSARDIFHMLHQQGILLESKPFALGVRIEHPQELIDQAQYHCAVRDPYLPAASYSLVQQVEEKGVFSFCMCPGGIIAPAATSPGELVVNGWSPSKRNNPFANSGTVVTIDQADALQYFRKQGSKGGNTSKEKDPLLLLGFQQAVEQKAWQAGGGALQAPAQRMTDFVNKKHSATLPACSYLPGISSAVMDDILPDFVTAALRKALPLFGKKMKGYYTNEAVLVATESRTSSPVRIPRTESFQHPQLRNLYPCAEGAGYAGGIVSAAMDGENVAAQIIQRIIR